MYVSGCLLMIAMQWARSIASGQPFSHTESQIAPTTPDTPPIPTPKYTNPHRNPTQRRNTHRTNERGTQTLAHHQTCTTTCPKIRQTTNSMEGLPMLGAPEDLEARRLSSACRLGLPPSLSSPSPSLPQEIPATPHPVNDPPTQTPFS